MYYYTETRMNKHVARMSFHSAGFVNNYLLSDAVTYTESGTPMMNWESRYICHFSTEMAEIWSPGTSFQDV